MKILVTGGAGFIGSHFIRQWLATHPDDKIINLDALTYAGRLETTADFSTQANYQFVHGSICDEKLVGETMHNVDLVVHFAAESHVDRSIESSREFFSTNVEGTRVLLEAARRLAHPPRFHHISTDEVFGSLGPHDAKFNEATAYDPRSPYSASKASSDHLVRAYYHTHALPITISNCSNNYGSFQFPEKLIPRFILRAKAGKKLPLYGKGANIRDWIYVGDHVNGIIQIIAKGKIGGTYCLGGNNEISNLEIAKQLLKILKLDETLIEFVDDRLGHDFRYAIDSSLAERELGWKAEKSFSEGLKETVTWYEKNEAWWKPLENQI